MTTISYLSAAAAKVYSRSCNEEKSGVLPSAVDDFIKGMGFDPATHAVQEVQPNQEGMDLAIVEISAPQHG